MDALRQLPELLDAGLQLVARGIERAGDIGRPVVSEVAARAAQRERQRHESLLRAVVEVTLQAASLGVGRLDDPCAGSAQPIVRKLERADEETDRDGEDADVSDECTTAKRSASTPIKIPGESSLNVFCTCRTDAPTTMSTARMTQFQV